jgi:glycosyltransferase involved in cell wall biosynthesis
MPPSRADIRGHRRRRLWIVNHYADAPDRANGTRHFDLGRRLVARGYDVTILASGFSHVTGREERLHAKQLYRIELVDGVQFVWLRTVSYRGNNWRRQLNMLSFVAALLTVQLRLPAPDTVVGSTIHPFAALGAWMVAKLRRATFIFEVRDLWPQTLVDLGAMREGSRGERLLRAIEAFLVRRAAIVITLLPGMKSYLLERGLPAGHVRYIPNGVDLEAFDRTAVGGRESPSAVQSSLAGIDRMHREGRMVMAYVGALGRVNEVATIIRAAAIADARLPGRIGVVIIGDGPERPALEEMAVELDAVEIATPVPKAFVPTVLRAIDVGIVHATANPVYRYGISFNKLFEYLAAARPVVFACSSAYDPVAIAEAGVSLAPNDPERLADAFLGVAGMDPGMLARMGSNGRAYVAREHDIERLAETLAQADEAGQRDPASRSSPHGMPSVPEIVTPTEPGESGPT